MLRTPTTFPHVGSTGYIAPTGAAVRILRRNADGRLLISTGDRDASGNTTVEAGVLHATRQAAIDAGVAPKPRRRRQREGKYA